MTSCEVRSLTAKLVAAVAFVALATGCTLQVAADDQALAYKLQPGPYEVIAIEESVLHDADRDKDLALRLYVPDATERFPVIIFSHGGGGSGDGYEELGRHWASHGYVCIHPTHADSLEARGLRWEIGPVREMMRDVLTNPEGWKNRAADISFIIDAFSEIETTTPDVLGKMDYDRIGVGGHSFGAYTSQVVGGSTIIPPGSGELISYRDERVSCILPLSPQGAEQMGLHEDSWEDLTLPTMIMSGSEDKGALGQPPEWRMTPFQRAPEGDKYCVFIEGANHFSFVGPQGTLLLRYMRQDVDAAEQASIFEYVKIASIAFWDAYLKGDQAALDYLASDALEAYGQGAVTLSTK